MTTISSGVSFLAQSQSQISRLKELGSVVDDLQRQVTTGKKHDSMTGFGVDAQRLLQLRADRDQTDVFMGNIDTAVTRINIMDDSLTSVTDSLRQVVDGLRLRPQGGQNDVAGMNIQAQQLLDFVADLTNVKSEGRYLFAGTDTQNPPYTDPAVVNGTFQADVANWLNGSLTTAQLLANADALGSTQLGFSSTLSGAQLSNVRVSRNTELTYGTLADKGGIENVIRTLSFLANIKQPDPAVDVPTNAEYEQVMAHIMDTALGALGQLDSTQVQLSGRLQLISSIRDLHEQDLSIASSSIDQMENTDMTEAVAMLQSMQTRLQASYETTKLVSQLTLVNFL